jgi:peptide-methionine (S)-S-oxide reductase
MVKIAAFIVAAAVASLVVLGLRPEPGAVEWGKMSSGNASHGLYFVKGITKEPANTELAMFSAGCFWGVEQEFRKQKGVVATAVGFTGGHLPNPTYEEVCTHTTGHAETVLLEYDPTVVSYKALLQNFWDMHDPTQGDRQGPDVGDNYRSAIWYFTPEQRKEAEDSKVALAKSGELSGPITTQIAAAGSFYKAEDYHQQYAEKGNIIFCHRRKG